MGGRGRTLSLPRPPMTTPGPPATGAAGGSVNVRSNRLSPCLHQTAVYPVRPGIRRRSMARVRVPAGWLDPDRVRDAALVLAGSDRAALGSPLNPAGHSRRVTPPC